MMRESLPDWMDWPLIFLYTITVGLGIGIFLLGVGWASNNDRINVLSKRIYDLEQRDAPRVPRETQ